MIFYPTLKASERYTCHPISSSTPSTDDPIKARDMVLEDKLGISIRELKLIMDDSWCRSHRASLARILGIYGDKQLIGVGSPDDM